MGTETIDEPFESYLEDSGGDEGFKEAESGVQEVLDGSGADLEQGDEEGNEECDEGCGVDGYDFFAEIGKFGVDDSVVLERYGERPAWCWG